MPIDMVQPPVKYDGESRTASFHDQTAFHSMSVQPSLLKSLSQNPNDDGIATKKTRSDSAVFDRRESDFLDGLVVDFCNSHNTFPISTLVPDGISASYSTLLY